MNIATQPPGETLRALIAAPEILIAPGIYDGLTALAAGSLGSTIALWREKTFQTLALTAMALVPWLLLWFPLQFGGGQLFGMSAQWWASAVSPLGALTAAAQPAAISHSAVGTLWPVFGFFLFAGAMVLAHG